MNKDILNIAYIYIGTVIGAGFASGREIIDFFGVYGTKGIIGMVISGLLFAFIGAYILIKVYQLKIKNSNELLNIIFGEKISLFIEAMLSGSGATFHDEFNLPFDFGIYLMASLCFIVFLFKIQGLSFINTLLVPILIIGILFLSVNVLLKGEIELNSAIGVKLTNKGNFITSSMLYVGFNGLLTTVVLSSTSFAK